MISAPKLEGNRWVFPSGESVPLVSGGSDMGLPDSIPGLGNNDPEYSEFAQGILNQIPDEDRPIVGKYIKDWDGNVTKRFQSIHDEYRPYKELGELEDIQEALSWIAVLNDDPVEFVNKVQAAMKEAGIVSDDKRQEVTLPEWDGVPDEFKRRFLEQEERINKLSGTVEQTTQQLTEKERIAALDAHMKVLHTEHGDFDDEWLLLQLSKGISPEDAIKSWKTNIVEKYGTSATKKSAPNLVTNPGAIPSPKQVDLSKMSKEERTQYAIDRLKAANAANAS
jgi:hypothetical protein